MFLCACVCVCLFAGPPIACHLPPVCLQSTVHVCCCAHTHMLVFTRRQLKPKVPALHVVCYSEGFFAPPSPPLSVLFPINFCVLWSQRLPKWNVTLYFLLHLLTASDSCTYFWSAACSMQNSMGALLLSAGRVRSLSQHISTQIQWPQFLISSSCAHNSQGDVERKTRYILKLLLLENVLYSALFRHPFAFQICIHEPS